MAAFASIVALVNPCRWSGKSVTAIYVARCWAARGKRVLVVDLDDQRAIATMRLGHPPVRRTPQRLEAEPDLTGLVVRERLPQGLHLLPGGLWGQAWGETSKTPASRLAHTLDQLKAQYDLILIDTPSSRAMRVAGAACAVAQWMVVPYAPGHYSISGTAEAFRLYYHVLMASNAGLKLLGAVPVGWGGAPEEEEGEAGDGTEGDEGDDGDQDDTTCEFLGPFGLRPALTPKVPHLAELNHRQTGDLDHNAVMAAFEPVADVLLDRVERGVASWVPIPPGLKLTGSALARAQGRPRPREGAVALTKEQKKRLQMNRQHARHRYHADECRARLAEANEAKLRKQIEGGDASPTPEA